MDGNIKPEVYNLLNNLPNEVLHHSEYGYLHPLGIYNRSLLRVSNGFIAVLNETKKIENEIQSLKVHQKKFVNLKTTELLKAQSELLYSIQSHIDDCFHILKTTSPYPDTTAIKSRTKKAMERSPSQWLYISKHPTVSYFKENIQEYKSFIDLIVNKLKHDHGRLRDVLLLNNYEKRLGYFVETYGVSSNGEALVRLDLEIHHDDTGFSYSRDLTFHFVNIYIISLHLKNALLNSFKEQYDLDLTNHFYVKENSTDFNKIINRIIESNLKFFPKEYLKPVPLIEWDQDTDTLFLCLDKEFRLNSDFFGTIRKIVTYTGDGTTKSFKLPLG